MKRKVNRVGQNTLTVSLPTKWAKKLSIKAGDEIDVEEKGRSIIITIKERAKLLKKTILNLDELNHLVLNRFIDEFYRQGVEEITLKFTKETIFNYKKDIEIEVDKYIKKLVGRYIGLEIISKTNNKIVLQSLITKEEYEKINVIEKRVYFLIKELVNEFIQSMESDFSKFHSKVYDYHDNIAKFSNYYLRLLNFSELSEEKKNRLFGLFIIIEKIIDKIRHTGERISEMKKITAKIKRYLKYIFELFIEQFELILKKDYSLNELDSLVKKRYNLIKKINLENFIEKEIKVISECKLLLDTINDFCEVYIALNIEKYSGE